MKFFGMLIFLFSAQFVLMADGPLKNNSFTEGLDGWKVVGTKAVVDPEIKLSGNPVLKICVEKPGWNRVSQSLQLEPDAEYELTFYLKCDNVVRTDKKFSGVFVGLSNGKNVLNYGIDGLWKYSSGTFDWKKASFSFSSKYFADNLNVDLSLQLSMDASGTFYFSGLSLKKKVPSAKQLSFQMNLFPMNFLKEEPFGICENLPGILEIGGDAHGKYDGKEAVFTLDVPKFLTLAGVSESWPPTRNGKREPLAQKCTEKEISKDGIPYRRYTVTFEKYFHLWFGNDWYTQLVFLKAEPGSTGKNGTIYWTFRIDDEFQKEEKGTIRILPPLKADFAPCKSFGFFIARSQEIRSPFPEMEKNTTEFWSSLSQKPWKLNDAYEKENKAYTNAVMIGGGDLMFPYPESRRNRTALLKISPADVDNNGKTLPRIACWYFLDDPDKKCEAYLKAAIREWQNTAPWAKKIIWDFEPHPFGLDEGGRARFARKMNLSYTPSIDEINSKYRHQYFGYMVNLHAQLIAKVAGIIREEAPETQFWLCTDNLHASGERVAAWCGVDAALSDGVVDGHMHMPYYSGTRYFDDMAYNVQAFRKPYFPLIDPSERLLSFYQQYTPLKLRQNLLATAALGGVGFGLWPDNALTGEYYQELLLGYGMISRAEPFYSSGKRCERDFVFTPKNTLEKEVKADSGQKVRIHFPDFSRSIRTVAHSLGSRILFTLFNYDEKQSVILQVSGNELKKEFLVKIPANGVITVDTGSLPDQKLLQKELAEFQATASNDLFREYNEGKSSILWGATTEKIPVLKLSNGMITAGIDTFSSGEIITLRDENGNELLDGGFLGRISFYDLTQSALPFRTSGVGIRGGVPSIESSAAVLPYEGANPMQNPLYGLHVKRTFSLKGHSLLVSIVFTNTTDKPVTFGFRTGNLPRPGIRFGMKGLKAETGGSVITPESAENTLLLKQGTEIPFLQKLKRGIWNGESVREFASDGVLSDTVILTPDKSFSGVYFWNTGLSKPNLSVEFLSPVLRLPPNGSMEFKYGISAKENVPGKEVSSPDPEH